MIRSMTAFASDKGEFGSHSWSWELRSVNGKGLDLRLRVPDWIEGLEAALRSSLSKALTRGNVSLTLRVQHSEEAGTLVLNEGVLASVLDAMARVERAAGERGVPLTQTSAADLLALRGVLEPGTSDDDTAPLAAAMKEAFGNLLSAFVAMREEEGQALHTVLSGHLDRVEALTAKAAELAIARREAVAETLRENLQRVLDNTDGADPDRVAQELALLAVKSDVTEEIDRLGAHVAAARKLLSDGGAVGRKLDFLMQEFNREANTLCSKSQNTELTETGLELKAVIDQMREQVQNIE